MSFHITLPSNTPSQIENTQSDFTIFLCDSLKLEGDYEVALSEINFSTNFNINFGSITLIHLDLINQPIFIDVKIPNGTLLVDFVYFLNKTIAVKMEFFTNQSEIIEGTSDNIYITNHETLPVKSIKKKSSLVNNFDLYTNKFFTLDNNIIKLVDKSLQIQKCEGLIQNLFPKDNSGHLQTTISRFLPDRLNIVNYIIVYTDIIEYQYFGNKKTQILRSIPITYVNGDIQTIFDTHHYVRVKNSFINSINIKLRDIWGNPIYFSDFFSFVIVNLHFKPLQ